MQFTYVAFFVHKHPAHTIWNCKNLRHYIFFLNVLQDYKHDKSSTKYMAFVFFHYIEDLTWVLMWSYMSDHILLNLLNELGGKYKMRGFAEHRIGFPQRV